VRSTTYGDERKGFKARKVKNTGPIIPQLKIMNRKQINS